MSGQRLLIVDNDRPFLKEHQAGLEATFEVEVVNAPDSAIQRLESGQFACVLISVEIADNRGYALCASIRRNAKLNNVKVGLISAKATEDEYKRHQGLKGRADLYLMKPIPPLNLVEALRPLVPPRGVDPDNPLGDLADDGDLAGDWLGDLKTDLGAVSEPKQDHAAGTVALSQAEIQAAMASMEIPPPQPISSKATAPPGSVKPDLSQAHIAHLEEELQAKSHKLKETEDALVQLQRQLNSVTVNLDELERGKKEAENLQSQLVQAKAALTKAEEVGDAESLRQQLREAIAERQTLIQQADQLNQQLSEKTTRNIELLRERDKLQSQVLESGDLQSKLEGAESAGFKLKAESAKLKEDLTGLEATVRGQGRQLAQMQDALTEAETKLKAAEETKATMAKDIETAMRESTQARKELADEKAHHEKERMELMGGMDAKEAELGRLKELTKSAQEANASLQKERKELQGQMADQNKMLKSLAALIEEAGEKLRQVGGLTKE